MDCNFCGTKIPWGTEYIHVTAKGRALYFCSSKCLKNLVKLNRKPRKIKWTKTYLVEKEARLKLLGQKPKAAEAVGEAKAEPEKKAKPSAKPTKQKKTVKKPKSKPAGKSTTTP
jgi:large subunit ribosomal protein L24e